MVPLFVAMDAIGNMPLFLGLTSRFGQKDRLLVLKAGLVTAAMALTLFLFLGQSLLSLMGISMADFEIAGGFVLLITASRDLLFADGQGKPPSKEETVDERPSSPKHLGITPLGIPMLAGPAAFTTVILLLHHSGLWMTFLSILANVMACGIIFFFGHSIALFVDAVLLEAIGRFFSLVLAAYGIMMMQTGINTIFFTN